MVKHCSGTSTSINHLMLISNEIATLIIPILQVIEAQRS